FESTLGYLPALSLAFRLGRRGLLCCRGLRCCWGWCCCRGFCYWGFFDRLNMQHSALGNACHAAVRLKPNGVFFLPIARRDHIATIAQLDEVRGCAESRPGEHNQTDDSGENVW